MKKLVSKILNIFKDDRYDEISARVAAIEVSIITLSTTVKTHAELVKSHAELISSLANSYHEIVKVLYDYSIEDEQAATAQLMMLAVDDDEFLN
jgi:molybdopterin biosynthesis enzyme MoaB